jgi:hypothetical protein
MPPVTTLDNGLSIAETAFINAYLSNGFNGAKAYMTIRPQTPPEQAKVRASQIITKGHVKQYLQAKIEEQNIQDIASKSTIMKEFQEVREKAIDSNKLSTALNASVEKGKLAGHYRSEESDLTQYQTLINQLTVNINQDKTDKPADIEVKANNIKELSES